MASKKPQVYSLLPPSKVSVTCQNLSTRDRNTAYNIQTGRSRVLNRALVKVSIVHYERKIQLLHKRRYLNHIFNSVYLYHEYNMGSHTVARRETIVHITPVNSPIIFMKLRLPTFLFFFNLDAEQHIQYDKFPFSHHHSDILYTTIFDSTYLSLFFS